MRDGRREDNVKGGLYILFPLVIPQAGTGLSKSAQ